MISIDRNVTANNLPIDAVLPQIAEALSSSASVVLCAPPGAGKTTGVPLHLLRRRCAPDGRIVVLQPRRFAARAAARRVAKLYGCRVGAEIGYHVRFDRQMSDQTKIVMMTHGVFLRQLQSDPFLERVAAVLFDEFHERGVVNDLTLGMTRRVQQALRPELKIVVMSATLATGPIAAYLDDCPIVESEGRLFDVDIRYRSSADRPPLETMVAEGVEEALASTKGDVLVFLPGVGEIRRAAQSLRALAADRDLAVMQLYGDLSADKQDAVLSPCKRRKVVLSTNLAETSVTIEGVTAVVDSGLARTLRFDPRVGLDRLELAPISRASADQRAGRAGRTQAGVCLRLWPRQTHDLRPEFDDPEIRRVDLAGPVLALKCWEEPDVFAFPWFDPPRAASIEQAETLLAQIGAIGDEGVTELGRAVAQLPTHPRVGRMLVEGFRLGHLPRAALAAAILTERDPFAKAGNREPASSIPLGASDVVDRVHALEEIDRSDTDLRGAARHVFQVARQLAREIERELGKPPAPSSDADAALRRAILSGFPDRVAKRREPASPRGVMMSGRGVRLAANSGVRQDEFFVCVDVDGKGTEATVRQASAVDREWLSGSLASTRTEVFFDEAELKVFARRRIYWGDLLLEESPAALPDTGEAAEILQREAPRYWDKGFPWDEREVEQFVARVRCLNEWAPELQLPPLDDRQLQSLLPYTCAGRRSLAEVRSAPWLDHIKGLFDWRQLQTIDREAPTHYQSPQGRRHRIAYEPGRPPVLAVKIQEMFGVKATPRVACGKTKLLLHLLAPSMRPQQVTDDLESFWTGAYAQIRKDLRGRYPKHAWPERP